MMPFLLVGAICSSICTAALSDPPQPQPFNPAVMYVSPNSAVITWRKLKPENVKDGYTIEYGKNWQHSKMLHVSRSSNTAMIPNLEPNTLYNIRVRVPDVKNGGSHPGPSVSFRTKTLVSASVGTPQHIAVVPLPFYRLLVTWDLPYRSRASDVVHYSLVFAPVYSPYLRKTSLILPGHYKSFTLTYLRPTTMYKVKIAALLKTRKGPYSSWVIAQTVGHLRLDNPGNRKTERPYRNPTEEPSVAMTSPSTYPITQATRVGLQLSTTQQVIKTVDVQVTSAQQTKQQPSIRPITESTARQATEFSMGSETDKEIQRTTGQVKSPPATTTSRSTTLPASTKPPTTITSPQTTLPPTTTTPKQNMEEATEEITTEQTKQPTEQTTEHITKEEKPKTTTQQMLLQPTTQSRTSPSYSTITISPKLVITGPFPTTATKDTCERMEPSMCSDIGYHTTKMANSKGNQSQMKSHVESMWSHLTPLCESQAKLKQFLCAASFPYCSKNLGGPFVPCRSMCMSTKKSCNMESYEDWPAEFDCLNFPAVGESEICISYGHETPAAPTTILQRTTTHLPITNNNPITQWSPIPPSNAPTSERQTATMTTAVTAVPALATRELKPLPNHCEPLFLKACDGVGYQSVQFPNYFNQKQQNAAGVRISRYWPLIEVTCSPLLKLFLCSLYTPICTSDTSITGGVSRNIVPCRSVCQQATSDCSYFMKIYGLEWPDGIKCDDFPDVNDDTCVSPTNLKHIRQGKRNAMPTSPSTTKEVQVTINRSSTKTTLVTLAVGISVEQKAQTDEPTSGFVTEPISAFKKIEKPASLTLTPKTGNIILQNEYVEDSTDAIAQQTAEEFNSTANPFTISTSVRGRVDQLATATPSSIPSTYPSATIPPPSGCETLYLGICKGVGYYFAQFPNYFNETHQNDAARSVYRFWNLVEMNCSPKLQLFLCSLYAPMCTKTPSSAKRVTGGVTHNILPCRSLCQHVKRECRGEMKLFGFKWPNGVECTNFPVDGDETCLYGNTNDSDSKGLLKIAREKKQKQSPKIFATPLQGIPSTPIPGTWKCLPLPADHTCKNHYRTASLSNASGSLQRVNKIIEDLISRIKDSASKKCLRNLEMFLCSLHSPRCSDDATAFGPCRSQCKTTLRRCGTGLLKKVNIDLSGLKDCRRFPLTKCTGNKRRPKTKIKSIKSL